MADGKRTDSHRRYLIGVVALVLFFASLMAVATQASPGSPANQTHVSSLLGVPAIPTGAITNPPEPITSTPGPITSTPVPVYCGPVINFAPAVTYHVVGAEPDSVAVGDFNGDGHPDLVITNNGRNPGSVWILLGNGNGAFRPPVGYFIESYIYSVTIGDFNRDGNLDLIVLNDHSNGGISVLLGNGDGTFRAAANYPIGEFAQSVAVGDFNSDGKQDLVTTNFYDNNISVLLGNGDGAFQPATYYPVGAYGPWPVAVGDFNNDGEQDLVTANNFSNNISALLGNGDGTFQAATNYPTGEAPQSIAVGDFNRDGIQDLVTANYTTSNISVLLGYGNGTFRQAVNYPVVNGPVFVRVADFSGDGKQDLVIANNNTNNVSALVGNGDGTFGVGPNFNIGYHPWSLAVGDFNGDGRQDLVTANGNTCCPDNPTLSVLLNTCTIPTVTPTVTPTITGTPLTATPTPTPTSTLCPAPMVSTNYLHVPYSGGQYTIQVDIGPDCNWNSWGIYWLQYYCYGQGVGPGAIYCSFGYNPTGDTRREVMSVCACQYCYDRCTSIQVEWDGPPPPTYTSTPTPPGIINGHLTWQGISQPTPHNAGITGTLSICVRGGGPQDYPVSTDASGFFTITAGLPDRTYPWWFKGPKWLANSGFLTISGGRSNPELGTQRAGDANNSGIIDSQDFIILKSTFGKPPGDPGYDPRADFNNDGFCNVTDFNLLKTNFGQAGAGPNCP